MDEELRGYLEESAKDKMRAGFSSEAAARVARVEMGSTESVKEGIRSTGWEYGVETVWQDVRYGVRQLRKNAGFTTAAVLTLGLGIGANLAIFLIAYSVFLRPLPFPHPDRVVRIERSYGGQIILNRLIRVRQLSSCGERIERWRRPRRTTIFRATQISWRATAPSRSSS